MSSTLNPTLDPDSEDELYAQEMEAVNKRFQEAQARIENERCTRKAAKEADRRKKEEEQRRRKEDEGMRAARKLQEVLEERQEEERRVKVEEARVRAWVKAEKQKSRRRETEIVPQFCEDDWKGMNVIDLPPLPKKLRMELRPRETRAEREAREGGQVASIGGHYPCARCYRYGSKCVVPQSSTNALACIHCQKANVTCCPVDFEAEKQMETEAKEKRAKVRQVKREEEEEWQADLRGNLILVLGHFYRMEQELTRIAESLERRQRQESEQDCVVI